MKSSLKFCLVALFATLITGSAFADQTNDSRFFVSADLGIFTRADNSLPNNNVLFDYGAKLGFSALDLGFSKLGFAVTYDRNRRSADIGVSSSAYVDLNNIDLQVLFLNIAGTGIYAGPIAGVLIATDGLELSAQDLGLASGVSGSQTSVYFTAGLAAGFDVAILDCLSVGPEVRYEHIFGDVKGNDLRFLGDVTYRF